MNSANRRVRRPIPNNNDRSQTVMVVLLAIVSALIFMAVALAIFVILYKPSVSTQPNGGNSITENPAVDPGNNEPVVSPVTEASQEGVTRKKDVFNFLVLGRDNVGLNTDIIMIVSFNVSDGDISIMQMPRDTYIKIYDSACKINSVYSKMHSRAYYNGDADTEDKGMKDMCAVLEANLGIEIDYYVLANLRGFGNIIDLIGGVPMDVPYDMYYSDPYQDLYIDIKAGQQVLNGAKAQQFIRFRSGYITGDIGRIDAQKLFMTALIEQLKNNINVGTVVGLVNEVYKNIKTSLSVADIIYFVKAFFTVNDTNINFVTFPGSDVFNGTYYVMKREDTLALLNKYFNVYTVDIDNGAFDPYLIFTNKSSNEIDLIYSSLPTANLNEYVKSAENIDDQGLYIPLT